MVKGQPHVGGRVEGGGGIPSMLMMCLVAAAPPALLASTSISGGNPTLPAAPAMKWVNEASFGRCQGHWSSITALHWFNSISSVRGTDMTDYWLRMSEVWHRCVTNSPAVLSLLGSPPCPGGPRHSKTAAAAQGAHADAVCQRVLSAMQLNRGKHSLEDHHCRAGPVFLSSPEAPVGWRSGSWRSVSLTQVHKPKNKCFTFSPGTPTNPCGPGKPCKKDRTMVSLSLCPSSNVGSKIFGPFFALLPGYRGCLAVQVLQFHLGSPVSNRKWCHEKHVGPQTPVFYHQSTHYVSLWALNAINSSNTLWGNNTRQLTAQSKSYLSVDSLVLALSQKILDSAVEEMTSVSDEIFLWGF